MNTFISLQQAGYLGEIHPLVVRKRVVMELFGFAWLLAKVIVLGFVLYQVFLAARSYHSHLPVPYPIPAVKAIKHVMTQAEMEQHQLHIALTSLQCPSAKLRPFSEGILKGAHSIHVDPLLITALLPTESNFKMNARSPKGYKGLMQTPWASMEYADVDILYGCRILEEKMHSPIAKGSIRTALALYKGGLSGEAFREADQVLRLYHRLQSTVQNKIAEEEK